MGMAVVKLGKFIAVILIGIVILGLFFYFKPKEAKGLFKDVKDSIIDIASNYSDSREINLGKPNLPCVNDDDCNSNIEKCESKCKCIGGNCIKNVQINTTN